MRFVFGAFVVLHGLVHLMYFAHAARYFELKPGMLWPDGSWALSGFAGTEAVRNLANISMILAAAGLVMGGVGVLLGQSWFRPVVVSAAVFSSVAFLLLWNGRMQELDAQGAIAILINAAILLAVLVFRWPLP